MNTLTVGNARSRRLQPGTALVSATLIGGLILFAGRCHPRAAEAPAAVEPLRQEQIARLQVFSAAKKKQAQALADRAGDEFYAGFEPLFDAAIAGDPQTVTNLWANFKKRHPQYEGSRGVIPQVTHWQPVLEVTLAYGEVDAAEPEYGQLAIVEILGSIPARAIYFGGTDPGRGLPTAFCESHADADPFFTVTQNALVDATYLEYLRAMYGDRIYIPTSEDLQQSFQDYLEDAQHRMRMNQLKPGEDMRMVDNRIQVSGQVAVMAINALLAQIIFEKNPDRQFYVEESFPLDWMYPHLQPHGLIMELNREPLAELSDEVLRKDHEYWSGLVREMIGDWLTHETSVQTVAQFAEKVHVRKDLDGFSGNPRFVRNEWAQRVFSKWRSTIGGVYAWRTEHAADEQEKARMTGATDLSFRQAVALWPKSPEAVFRYADFLVKQDRASDALLIAQTAAKVDTQNEPLRDLVRRLQELGEDRDTKR